MLELVEKKIKKYIDELKDDYIRELFKKLPAGKRLRAKLILKIAKSKEAIDLAAIIEMIHAASLLHDDVIDDALIRRGVPSINSIYGNKTSIMFGDILYSKAFYELTNFDKNISKIVSDAVTKLSIGELLDVNLSNYFNTDIDLYLDMIYKKTASLIEASAKSAAILAGLDQESYALYGKNLGLAFQIVDDILDITQDEKTLGKPSMNDFKEGKVTLPYIYLYNSMNEYERNRLKSLFRKEIKKSEREWIKSKMAKYKSIDRAKEFAKKLANDAIESVEDKDLKEVMKNLIDREY